MIYPVTQSGMNIKFFMAEKAFSVPFMARMALERIFGIFSILLDKIIVPFES
jgi:hypothetical protein